VLQLRRSTGIKISAMENNNLFI